MRARSVATARGERGSAVTKNARATSPSITPGSAFNRHCETSECFRRDCECEIGVL